MIHTNSGAHQGRRFGMSAKACAMSTVSAFAMLTASFAATQSALAQPAQSSQQAADAGLEELVVTGSRIVRDGYEAPTPVTVIGIQQIEQQPMQHISDFVQRLPAFAGAQTTTSGGNEISTGRQSQNNLNLRGLEVFRTLVLLDGNRIVSGDVNGAVNVSDLPTPLINRVDVVTGGASAAYGSDAVSGVVNFILDKEFTGVKGEIQSGITNYGDDPSYKVSLTTGTEFGGGRGHILLSGEHAWNKGIYGASEQRGKFWGYDTAHLFENPAWGTGAGQSPTNPRWLLRNQVSTLLATPGGIITAGPLKGTQFDPNGNPFPYLYGGLVNSQFTAGGDWKSSDATFYNQTLSNKVSRQAYFGRVSYDITDTTSVFFNLLHSASYGYARSKLDDQLGNMTIKADNAFLNPTVLARMVALGQTQFTMGSFNLDMPPIQTDNYRNLWSYSAGIEGEVSAFNTDWQWNAYGQYGLARSDLSGRVLNLVNFRRAFDAVRNPAGQIVCRVNVATVTDPTCVPWNPFGYGNNSAAAVAYSKGRAQLYQRNTEHVFTFGLTGNPFEAWAGPVSVATGFEWRREAVAGIVDPLTKSRPFTAGNYQGTDGKYTVAEGYLETVIPLLKDRVAAKSLDFNAAIRATDYSTSGYVTTWKAGLTYQPLDDVRTRVTRSRDIRAGNLGELYNNGGGGQSPGLLDPFRPGATPVSYLNSTSGNPLLLPEKADTTSLGIVYQPSWFEGFSASVDYYNINIKGAIDSIGGTELLDRCFLGQQSFCAAITRLPFDPVRDAGYTVGPITLIDSQPFNLTALHQQGWDIEASYTTGLDRFNDSLAGDLTLRAIGTHIVYSNRDDGRNPVVDVAGTNNSQGPLNWRWLFNANYALDKFTVAWTGRFMSAGRYGNSTTQYVQCSPGSCPVSTVAFPTLDNNHIDSRFYHDLALTYRFYEMEDGGSIQGYLNISNLMNKEPPLVGSTNYWYMTVNPIMYDTIGRKFFGGIRFKM